MIVHILEDALLPNDLEQPPLVGHVLGGVENGRKVALEPLYLLVSQPTGL